jgi:hypothetical protein
MQSFDDLLTSFRSLANPPSEAQQERIKDLRKAAEKAIADSAILRGLVPRTDTIKKT